MKTPADDASITVVMSLARGTKGTHVYTSSDPGTPIETVYVLRRAFPDKAPPRITLTIAAAPAGDAQ